MNLTAQLCLHTCAPRNSPLATTQEAPGSLISAEIPCSGTSSPDMIFVSFDTFEVHIPTCMCTRMDNYVCTCTVYMYINM